MTEIPGDASIGRDTRGPGRGLAVAAILVGLVVLLLPVKYVVNDDPSFAMMLSGSDGFQASADVPFLSRILSQGLYCLYALIPAVPWYGLCLYLSAWLGLGLLLSVPVSGGVMPAICLAMLVGWFPYLAFGLYNISMTQVTLWLQLGVFLHLFYWLRCGRSFRLAPGILCVALALGYLWRWEMFLVFLVFAVPLLALIRKGDLRRCAPYVLALLALVVTDRVWESVATGSSEHKQYQAFNRARGYFHDRAEGQRNSATAEALEAVGWSENDYLAFHDVWMLYDEEVLTEAALRNFVERNRQESAEGWLVPGLDRVRQVVLGNRMYLPPFALSLAVLLVMVRGSWSSLPTSERRRMGGALLITAAMMSAILFVRFVPRVSFPLFVYLLGLAALVAVPPGGRLSFRKMGESALRSPVLGLMVVLVLGCWLYWARVDLSSMRSENGQRTFVRRSIESFVKEVEPQALLVPLDPGVALAHVGGGPFRERLPLGTARLLPSGWSVRSARYHAALRASGVTDGQSLLKKAVTDEAVYFVRYVRPWDVLGVVEGAWEKYYTEHFPGAELRLEHHFEKGGYQLMFS
ncbi:MAG: hypothetical protein OSB47_10650, partial [Pirellulaceae bacterium]|nr:hypothetical protein [Pirellulaceae bacterium]